ncbi:hypothetical protein IWX88_002792 [Frigoribacterium sp. CG_9.8]|nr:hypothetical protein [Frigoribacterium sp. CG_9.8]
MTRNGLINSPSMWVACCALPPNFNSDAETLRRWFIQADIKPRRYMDPSGLPPV